MTRLSLKRCAVVLCLLVLAGALGGCSKCDGLWGEAPKSCRADAPR